MTEQELILLIKRTENYIERDYQTVGGMWTVDTWRKGGITLQLMDEGYTTRVFNSEFEFVFNSNGLTWNKGDPSMINKVKL